MKQYYVTVWEDGHKWCQLVGTNDIKATAAIYKAKYDRVLIEERK